MENFQKDVLSQITLAPYLQAATALIGKSRRVGGNQFRHVWATVGILLDYKIIDSVILKAAMLHDLKEDAPECYFPDKIRSLDEDGPRVVELVEELSINKAIETKPQYLQRVMLRGTKEAKIIKLADRISNLTDVQLGTFNIEKICKIIEETRIYILPYAKDINSNMVKEISFLLDSRQQYLQTTINLILERIITIVVNKINTFRNDINNETQILLKTSQTDIDKIIDLQNQNDREQLQANLNEEINRFNGIIEDTINKVIDTLHIESTEFIQTQITQYKKNK